MTGYFTPLGSPIIYNTAINADGWYQLPLPGATYPVLADLVVPDGAQGLLLQVIKNTLAWAPNPPSEELADTHEPLMIATDGTYLLLPGRPWVTGLSFLLVKDNTMPRLALQFLTGGIGPLPQMWDIGGKRT